MFVDTVGDVVGGWVGDEVGSEVVGPKWSAKWWAGGSDEVDELVGETLLLSVGPGRVDGRSRGWLLSAERAWWHRDLCGRERKVLDWRARENERVCLT